jgi:hypothetical protein
MNDFFDPESEEQGSGIHDVADNFPNVSATEASAKLVLPDLNISKNDISQIETPKKVDPPSMCQTGVMEKVNSRTSTGPRTHEGKRRSKRNSTRHGIFADIVLTGEPFRESLGDYTRLLEQFREDIQPVGAVENVLVEQLAFEFLRLGRLYRADARVAPRVFEQIEKDLMNDKSFIFDPGDPKKEALVIRKELASELLLRYGNGANKRIDRILDRIERLQRIRKGQPLPPQLDVKIS